MSEIFILGAGFSKALSNEMPTVEDLYCDLRKSDKCSALLELDLWESNFEMLLTYLAQKHPWLPENQNLRNRAAFIELSTEIQKLLSHRTDRSLQDMANKDISWVYKLLSRWANNRINVITLNYDALVEILSSSFKDAFTNSPIEIRMRSIFPVEINSLGYDGGRMGDNPRFTLYKLHGSVSWFYSGSSEFSGEDITGVDYIGGLGGYFERRHEEDYRALQHKVPLIIPPVLDKSLYFQKSSLKATWQLALNSLKAADRIYCLGYSLPEFDVTMRFFLQGNEKRKKPFIIVNKNPETLQHFKSLLPGYECSQPFEGEGCIKEFVEDLVR